MPLDPRQEGELTGGGDSLLHYHLADRVPTHDTLNELQRVMHARTVTTNYTCTFNDDIVLADTASGGIVVYLPPLGTGKLFILKKRNASHTLTIQPTSGVTIDDAANKVINAKCASITVKDVGFGWMIIGQVP